MATYTKPTGTAGELRLDITYVQDIAANTTTFTVKRIISCTDPATFTGGLDWDGNDAGTSRSGEADLTPAGGWSPRELGAWTVTKTHSNDGTLPSQTFTFNIDASSTQGLGGPTSLTATLDVPRIPRGPRVRHAGTWRHTVAYVKTGGAWKIALPYVKTGGTWKVGGA